VSLDLDSVAEATAASTARGFHWLVELEFTGGTVYFTTSAVAIPWNGNTYIASGGGVEVSAVSASENTAGEKITLSVPVMNSAFLAAALDPTTYRGRAVRLYGQFIDSTFQPAGEPKLCWQGYMEPVRIERKPSQDGPSTLPCTRAGMARARNAEGLRLSDAQQQAEFIGDKFYEYIPSLLDKQQQWLSRRFQASFE
jgi:hypothetical protein